MSTYNEDAYEHTLIELFRETMGYDHIYGPDILLFLNVVPVCLFELKSPRLGLSLSIKIW